MHNFIKREWPFALILLIPIVIAIIVYPYMPDQVPIHWNVYGEVDDYGSKTFGTFFLPVLNLIMYLFISSVSNSHGL